MSTAPWVQAAHAAMDAAAAGEDPVAAVSHLDERDAERALHSALTIIERAAWVSDRVLQEPHARARRDMIDRHTRKNPGLRSMVEARVRRKWESGHRPHREGIAKAREMLGEDQSRR